MPTWVLAVVLLAVLVGLGAVLTGLQGQRGLSETTTGRILSGQTVGAESRGQSCRATVAYRVDGYGYRFDALVGGACPTAGASDRTTVRYDPDSPGNVDTRPPSRALYGIAAAALLGALLCVLLLLRRGVDAARRRREPGDGPAPRGMYS